MNNLHPYLQNQLKKHLCNFSEEEKNKLASFIQSINATYQNYDKDRELFEHAFSVNEQEYEAINNKLKQLTKEQEAIILKRTEELNSLARLPLENPNPTYQISFKGDILFINEAGKKIRVITYREKNYDTASFFYHIVPQLNQNGSIEVESGSDSYLFHYIKSDQYSDINFYGTNVSEKNQLRKKAYDNFYRLSNFLESTNDAYYVLYHRFTEKNFITSKWANIFGFNPNKVADPLKERLQYISSQFKEEHKGVIDNLKLGERKFLSYSVCNAITGETFWVEETISKQFDTINDDVIITGKITDVTKTHKFSMQLRESEERFRILMDDIPVMVWVSDETNKIIYGNKLLKKLLKHEITSIENLETLKDVLHPDDFKNFRQIWLSSLHEKTETKFNFRILDKNNRFRNLFQKSIPRYYKDGRFAGYIGVMLDFTQEKKYEHKLYEEKKKLELVSKNSPDIVMLLNEKGNIEYISPSVKRLLGYSESEIMGKPIFNYLADEIKYRKRFNEILQLKKNKRKLLFQFKVKKRNNELIWVESAFNIITSEQEDETKFLLHVRDINKLKLAEESLEESEQKYRGLFENMQLGVMEVSVDDEIKWVNRSFQIMTGYSLKELKGKKAWDVFITHSRVKDSMKTINNERRNKKNSIYEISLKNKSGKLLDVVISGSPIIDKKGEVRGSVGIHWDVTALNEMQRKLDEEKTIREREILKASLNAEEKQREMLGRELHDGVGQMLTYTSLYIQMASKSHDSVDVHCANIQKKLLDILSEVRRISRSLVPPALKDLGLKEALIDLIEQYAIMNKTAFTLNCTGNRIDFIDTNAQTTLYRITQELVNNTVKHAEAKNAELIITFNKTHLKYTYRDNGKGFDVQHKKKGVGLMSIASRVAFYEGRIAIQSNPEHGTEFVIEFPLEKIEKNEQAR